jgi:hypothetical protein
MMALDGERGDRKRSVLNIGMARVPIQEVQKHPEGINGLCCYRFTCDAKDMKKKIALPKE